jgi:glycosyltransferase involved in cell wall biosynthesis
MRIGVMLRHYDQHGGGVRVYTQSLLSFLVKHATQHEYVLFYQNPSLLGTFRGAHVKEVCVAGRSVFTWDQVGLPRALASHPVDVLFNPKYSLPLTGSYPTVWVCHGLDWYVMPWASRLRDRLSHRFLVPRYAARASAIIAVSEITRQHVLEFLGVTESRVTTVYTGIDDVFHQPIQPEVLASIRTKYGLPPRFMLYVGAVYPPKNFRRMVQAYARVGPQQGIALVVAGGQNRFLSEEELKEPERLRLGQWVKWAGWVDAATLAAFYQLAEGLLMPSLFESFGIPIVEAMASGCPVLTSDCYGTKEIGADAALLVDPNSVDSIANGIATLVGDTSLQTQLRERGRTRAGRFTWERCAGETLDVLERAAADHKGQGCAA